MTDMQTDDPAPAASSRPFPDPEPRGNLTTFLRSPGVKFIMIGVISVALLVPLGSMLLGHNLGHLGLLALLLWWGTRRSAPAVSCTRG